MCGIAGIWRFKGEKISEKEIEDLTNSMIHRGPDGGGSKIFENENLALGHRRLSIVDLSALAAQPMSSKDGDLWITYNGEIYNFIEVRKELQLKGSTFKTHSDTEVILEAYRTWGETCLHKFNGMFAFCIYDRNKQDLFLARDRFGVKPLHYSYKEGSYFAFASETLAFKHLKDFNRHIQPENFIYSINNPGLLDPTGSTIFEDVFQLKGGHFARINTKGIRIEQWYELSAFIKPVQTSYSEQVEQFRELFFSACKLRLRSDVSVASALSGGIDSSSVFCSIHHLSQKNYKAESLPADWQQAFSVSFPGTSQDESKYVKLIRDRLEADVKIIEHDHGDLVSDIVTSTVLLDNIIGTPIISASEVYKAMRANGITVSLDGHAGDELLFGYRSAVYELLFEAHLSGGYDKDELAQLYLLMGNSASSPGDVRALNEKLHGIVERFRPSLKNKMKNVLSSLKEKQQDEFKIPSVIKGHGSRNLYKQFKYVELPYNLRDFDRASMQNSIEIRMPFMDYRLVEFAWSLPAQSKIGQGFTKRILRDAMRGIVPDEILDRKTKIGLGAPTAEWFNTTLSEFVIDTVNSGSFKESPYWDGQKLSEEFTALTKNKSWTQGEAAKAWCVLNAHIVSSPQSFVSIAKGPVADRIVASYQQCTNCLMDNKITKEISFNAEGVCSYCTGFERMRSYTFGRPKQVLERELNKHLERMKRHGKGKPYDCIIGLSGGVDSTYVAYLVKKLGLRALAVHFDNGWNSELAVKNIENIIKKTGFDLQTYVVNWDEFKDLQRAYLKASVIDVEVLSDHMIVASLYRLCKQYKIKYLIAGTNLATEYVIAKDWVYNKNDLRNIVSIHEKFGTVPLKTFPKLGFTKLFFQKFINGYRSLDILNYVDYKKNAIKDVIKEEFDWKDYGGKHYESVWTKFYQGNILPKKFGVDKRIAHLSNLIVNKELSKDAARAQLERPPLTPSEEKELEEYVLKKLDFSPEEWRKIMDAKPIPHEFYDTEDRELFVKMVKGIRKLKWTIIVNYLVPLKRVLVGKKADV
jgi:asparagine synthase (glutamine-hydrolysing)